MSNYELHYESKSNGDIGEDWIVGRWWKIVIFLLKWVPYCIFMFKYIKNNYTETRQWLKRKQKELEDLQLQAQILDAKLSVREVEFAERKEYLRRSTERLRQIRRKVREVIATNKDLQRTFDNLSPMDGHLQRTIDSSAGTEHEFIMELIKALQYDQVEVPVQPMETREGGEPINSEHDSDKVCASTSEFDIKQKCRIKIVKVTNVCNVSCLKRYIHQRRLRRATKKAILIKKMENMKKMLNDWNTCLDMATNRNLFFPNNPYHEIGSQEAGGDYSKPHLNSGSSDSDSDFVNNGDNNYLDEHMSVWNEHQYIDTTHLNDDVMSDTADARECYDTQDLSSNCEFQTIHHCEYKQRLSNTLYVLPEETTSKMTIEEIKSVSGTESDSHDLIP